eukprot:2157823-Prymnesium_polylepis.1
MRVSVLTAWTYCAYGSLGATAPAPGAAPCRLPTLTSRTRSTAPSRSIPEGTDACAAAIMPTLAVRSTNAHDSKFGHASTSTARTGGCAAEGVGPSS